MEGRVFTLADINLDWAGFTTESLFSEADRLAVIQKNFPNEKKFDKSKFNNAITDIYAMSESFTFDEETIGRFTELFEAIDKLMPEGAQRVICNDK